ncbi:endonuclease domain-containing protein [Patescibacteria group bacterium]|nr:endonuclease domain-containing protein [Patescibacteria group bacterium]
MTEIFNQEFHKEKRKTLRSEMPVAERKLWMELRGKRLDDYKFRRQFGISKYIVDFYCPSAHMAIEIDGDSHYEAGAQKKDAVRQSFIESFGIKVLRFTNTEVRENMEQVLDRIRECIKSRRPPLTPPSQGGG